MRKGISTAFGAALALALTLALSACGSGSGNQAVSAHTANRLAAVSDEIASDLDAGDTCTAAHRADDLVAAVRSADLPDDVRPQVETVASQLVNEVNCPAPVPVTTTNEKDHHGPGDAHGHGQEGGDSQGDCSGHGHGDEHKPPEPPKPPDDQHLPPGQAKKIKQGHC
jgi:hypothetical protein